MKRFHPWNRETQSRASSRGALLPTNTSNRAGRLSWLQGLPSPASAPIPPCLPLLETLLLSLFVQVPGPLRRQGDSEGCDERQMMLCIFPYIIFHLSIFDEVSVQTFRSFFFLIIGLFVLLFSFSIKAYLIYNIILASSILNSDIIFLQIILHIKLL